MSDHLVEYLTERTRVLETRLNGLPAALEAMKAQVNKQVVALIAEAGLTERFELIQAQLPVVHQKLQREADMLKMALAELNQALKAAEVEDEVLEEPLFPQDDLENPGGPGAVSDLPETIYSVGFPRPITLCPENPTTWRDDLVQELHAQGITTVDPLEDILAVTDHD